MIKSERPSRRFRRHLQTIRLAAELEDYPRDIWPSRDWWEASRAVSIIRSGIEAEYGEDFNEEIDATDAGKSFVTWRASAGEWCVSLTVDEDGSLLFEDHTFVF